MTSRIWRRTHSTPLLLLLLLISLPVAECSIRLCGVRLTRTLMAICRNQLCGYSQSKRSAMWEEPRLETVHSTMKRSGIATECCENRCSFSYLKTYCCST